MSVRVLNLPAANRFEDDHVLTREAIKRAFLDNLFCVQGKTPALATRHDYYMALAYTVRDRMMHRWISTAETYASHGSRTVAYLSAEFLIGPQLGSNLASLGMLAALRGFALGFDPGGRRDPWPLRHLRAWRGQKWL